MKIRVLLILLFIIIQRNYSVEYVLTVANQTMVDSAVTFDLYIHTTNSSDTIFLASCSFGWTFNNNNFTNPDFSIDSGTSANMKNRNGVEVLDLFYSFTTNPPNGNILTSDLAGPDPPSPTYFNQRVARVSNQPLFHKFGRFRIKGISNYNGYLNLAWYLPYLGIATYQSAPPFNVVQLSGTCEVIPNLLMPVKNINMNKPEKFDLLQNYPNPFNPVTCIEFEIQKYSYVNLSIYDVCGKLVSVLVNEYLPGGFYKMQFNANNYSSGTYFYRMTSGNFTQVRKMILLK